MNAIYFQTDSTFHRLRGHRLEKPVLVLRSWTLLAILCCLVNAAVADVSGNFIYTDNGSSVSITGCVTAPVGAITIPATIHDPVTLLEDPVTGLGASAFNSCNLLTEVTFQAGSGVKSIGSNAFYSCIGLTKVILPAGLESIGAGAFYRCIGLTSMVIPSGVIGIAGGLFFSCSGLTSVTIPSSVVSIGAQAFQYCSSLTSISVDGANQAYSSLHGVLFNKFQTSLIIYPPGLGGGYAIPSTVTAIGSRAFYFCTKLVGVTLPANLGSIGSLAFYNNSALLYANFTGNAPTMSAGVFDFAAQGFAIYYLNGATGFPSPTWLTYPTVNMGSNGTPITAWLLGKGLPANANLQSDFNGDGVNLLMSYALNYDPYQRSSFPTPVFGANQMSMSFYAGAPGMTYTVLASDNLQNWSSTGVTLSSPDASQMCTATVGISGSKRFMCLKVNN